MGLTLALALLMVSTVRYWSGKVLALSRMDSFFMLVAVIVVIFFIALHPETVLFVMAMLYILSGMIYEAFNRRPLCYLIKRTPTRHPRDVHHAEEKRDDSPGQDADHVVEY